MSSKPPQSRLTLVTPSVQTYHPNTLQVHFCTPELLPAIMAIALALGQAAEVTCELKDISDKRTPTDLISWHLQGHQGQG